MNRILVTGGAGYIGSVFVTELLKLKYEVTVLDNFMYGQAPLFDCGQYHKSFQLVRGDVRNESLLKKLMAESDVIFPLAAVVGAPACDMDPTAATTINLDAIKLILKLRKDQKIIFPNTNSGYGIGQEGICCDESTPLNPISLYGKLKVEAERSVLAAGNTICLRLATVFGLSPRMRLDLLVNDLVYKAVTDGYAILYEPWFKRNYIHVRDVARAFIHCLFRFEEMKGEVYNLGLSDANLSKWELCEEIKRQVPEFYFTEAPLKKDLDQRNYIVSNAKIESTGFRPQYSLPYGIAELINGYRGMRKPFSNI